MKSFRQYIEEKKDWLSDSIKKKTKNAILHGSTMKKFKMQWRADAIKAWNDRQNLNEEAEKFIDE